jgi:GATA-binding protein
VIKKRNRGSGNSGPASTSTRSAKKSSRKNSLAQTPATTPTSAKASHADSESPKSTGSVGAGTTSTNGAAATSGASKAGGVVAIAPGPPKSQSGSATNPSQSRAAQVVPNRSRGESTSGVREFEMTDAEDTSGRAPRRKLSNATITPTTASNTVQNLSLGPLPMGAMGQGLQSSGPQEWEWLTMSL